MAVSAVAGIGGVGKTTLAVHVAHAARDAFPDGQLYVDLQGTEPRPADPEVVLGAFLRALGVPNPAIPETLAERAALYRSTLDGRRVLALLDNAYDAAQIRQLLPGTPGCAALVTSRVRMVDLAGAHLVDLDVMSPEEALQLFTRIVGEERVAQRTAGRARRGRRLRLPAAGHPDRRVPARRPPHLDRLGAGPQTRRPAAPAGRTAGRRPRREGHLRPRLRPPVDPNRPARSGCCRSPRARTSHWPRPPRCSAWTRTRPRNCSKHWST